MMIDVRYMRVCTRPVAACGGRTALRAYSVLLNTETHGTTRRHVQLYDARLRGNSQSRLPRLLYGIFIPYKYCTWYPHASPVNTWPAFTAQKRIPWRPRRGPRVHRRHSRCSFYSCSTQRSAPAQAGRCYNVRASPSTRLPATGTTSALPQIAHSRS